MVRGSGSMVGSDDDTIENATSPTTRPKAIAFPVLCGRPLWFGSAEDSRLGVLADVDSRNRNPMTVNMALTIPQIAAISFVLNWIDPPKSRRPLLDVCLRL
jgi:hypothetical protein